MKRILSKQPIRYIVGVKAISWREPHWEFDYPTIVLAPYFRYSPNGKSPMQMIEDLAIEMCSAESIKDLKDHNYSEEFLWRGWNLGHIKSTFTRLSKQDHNSDTGIWKTKLKEHIVASIEFKKYGDQLESFEIFSIKSRKYASKNILTLNEKSF